MIDIIQTVILGVLALILAVNTLYLNSVVTDIEKMLSRHDDEIKDLKNEKKFVPKDN